MAVEVEGTAVFMYQCKGFSYGSAVILVNKYVVRDISDGCKMSILMKMFYVLVKGWSFKVISLGAWVRYVFLEDGRPRLPLNLFISHCPDERTVTGVPAEFILSVNLPNKPVPHTTITQGPVVKRHTSEHGASRVE